MARVRAHTRKVNGKRQRVRAHTRHLQPRRAGHNLKRAYRYNRRKQNGKAAWCAGIAIAEIAGWATMRGAGIALVTLGVVAIGLGVAARKASTDPDKPLRSTPPQKPRQPVKRGPETSAERGRRHAREDVAAGGFGKGWQRDEHARETSEQDTADYEREYMRNTPRSWRE